MPAGQPLSVNTVQADFDHQSNPEREVFPMTTYTVRRLAWFGMRLWRAIQQRKDERAKNKAPKAGVVVHLGPLGPGIAAQKSSKCTTTKAGAA
jgi:hypothetical protein